MANKDRYKVVRHKRGWAVERHYSGLFTGKEVVGIYRTKADALETLRGVSQAERLK